MEYGNTATCKSAPPHSNTTLAYCGRIPELIDQLGEIQAALLPNPQRDRPRSANGQNVGCSGRGCSLGARAGEPGSLMHLPDTSFHAAAGMRQVDLMDKRLGAGRREAELVLSVGGEEGWLSN